MCCPARRSPARITGSSPGVTVTTTSCAAPSSRSPASQPISSASSRAASGRTSAQTPGPYPAAARQRAAQAPFTPQPMIPTEAASSRARACAETAAAAPVRSEVTEEHSITASSSPVSASESRTSPRTTGNPFALLPGNDVTHLSSASPSPRAGIARKSPCGGLSR